MSGNWEKNVYLNHFSAWEVFHVLYVIILLKNLTDFCKTVGTSVDLCLLHIQNMTKYWTVKC